MRTIHQVSFDPIAALADRVRRDPSSPLITWYDTDRHERVELSARTLANWVDKTANLLDDLGAGDSPTVGLPVAIERPGHWVCLVWTLATWQRGGRAIVAKSDELGPVDVAVVGPAQPYPLTAALDTVACSLHPLGLAFDEPLDGVVDYHDVLAQPDVHLTGGDAPADVPDPSPTSDRVLVRVGLHDDALTLGLLGPLAGGGSGVIVAGAHPDVTQIADAEHARVA